MVNRAAQWLIALDGALLFSFLIVRFAGQLVWVKGGSMKNTLLNRDLLLVTKWGSYKRNEVVICRYPRRTRVEWTIGAAVTLTLHTLFVKRLVALPGDTVEIREGVLYVNEEAAPQPPEMGSAPRDFAPRKLGRNQYFVMGDNRASSHDSRAMDVGPLPGSMLQGHVKRVLWPVKRWKKVI